MAIVNFLIDSNNPDEPIMVKNPYCESKGYSIKPDVLTIVTTNDLESQINTIQRDINDRFVSATDIINSKIQAVNIDYLDAIEQIQTNIEELYSLIGTVTENKKELHEILRANCAHELISLDKVE